MSIPLQNRNSAPIILIKLVFISWLHFVIVPKVISPRPEHIRTVPAESVKDAWVSVELFQRAFLEHHSLVFLIPIWSLLVFYVFPRPWAVWFTSGSRFRWLRGVFWSRLWDPISSGEMLSYLSAYFGTELRLWSYDALGREFTFFVRSPDNLISTGPYAWLVHPSYTALLMVFIPVFYTAGFRGIWVWSFIFFIMSVILYMRITNEEAVLRETFTDQFDGYLKERWRLIPYLV